jgi:ribosomal protein S1
MHVLRITNVEVVARSSKRASRKFHWRSTKAEMSKQSMLKVESSNVTSSGCTSSVTDQRVFLPVGKVLHDWE